MSREETIRTIVDRFREMSTETIMFHQAVADELDLYITDHKCMDIIHRFGAMSAGRLGEMTGLTTGAITGMIDRLEKAGYVRRANDPKDRRKTIVEPIRNKKLERKIEMIFCYLAVCCIHEFTIESKIITNYILDSNLADKKI